MIDSFLYDGAQRIFLGGAVYHSLTCDHLRPRRQAPTRIVLHWTGADNPARSVHRTLNSRGLSVDFCVDQMGHVWQFNPNLTALRTMHAGPRVNASSFGIEVVGRGFGRGGYTATIHGKEVRCLDFNGRQYRAIWALVSTLCYVFEIPEAVCLSPTVVPDPLPRGILGHFQISPRKFDPGTQPLLRLHELCSRLDLPYC